MIVDAEYLARDNRRLARLLKEAELRIPGACMEDVDGSASRGVDRAMLRQLATCAWVGDHLNVLVSGSTGVGKSYWRPRSASAHAVAGCACCIDASPASSMRSPSRGPTAPTRGSWRGSRKPTF